MAVNKDTLDESAELLKVMGKKLAEAATVNAVQPWLHPEAVELLAPGNSKGKGKGPDNFYGNEGVSVIGQEGFFNFPKLGCVNHTVAASCLTCTFLWMIGTEIIFREVVFTFRRTFLSSCTLGPPNTIFF